ncbi:MAG: hypothetical protein ACK5WZ_00590 [Pseudobdellovibrionaceae bacterium]
MSMNPLPPQAYTKDALQKAYAWLMNQPPSIRELATTPEVLVSLYLKTQRDGMETLDRPSIQNFRSELKQLAGMMSEFSEHENISTMPAAFAEQKNTSGQTTKHSASHQTQSHLKKTSVAETSAQIPATFDNQKMIQEVKDRMGFSSDQQALDALIRVGFHHLVTRIFKP